VGETDDADTAKMNTRWRMRNPESVQKLAYPGRIHPSALRAFAQAIVTRRAEIRRQYRGAPFAQRQ
jgi:hypothetical protein